jgi:hypothetical protein
MKTDSSPAVAPGPLPRTGETVTRNSQGPIKDTLELGAKLLFGLVGACYVLGLIVVTIHLRAYGLNSLSLSQLHYVTAGVWVLLPILVMIFLGIFTKFMFDAQEKSVTKTRGAKAREIVPALLGVIIVFMAAVEYLGKPFGIQLSLLSWGVIPVFGTLAFLMLALAVFMLMSNAADRPPVWVAAGIGVVAVVLFMVYVVLFAGHTYREIPWGTGGARASQVELVVASDTKAYLESAGIKFSGGQNRTDSLQLILATEKEYVIVNADGKAVSIPSDSVKTVLYEK